MYWNYRIVETPISTGVAFGLYEVHYHDDGEPFARTTYPASFCATTTRKGKRKKAKRQIKQALKMALKDASNRPVLGDWEIKR